LGAREMAFLDVAGASGDNAAAAEAALAKRGVALRSTLVDLNASHLASEHHSAAGIAGDAMRLPFRDEAFDVAGSALFLHHLEPEQIVAVTREMLRVSKHAVIVNDLHRCWPHWLVACAGGLIYRSRLTRHDAPVSVRRAYTQNELRGILKRTHDGTMDATAHFFFRNGFILWKRTGSPQ
jgi:ubiquinone/menaquinone biosynthesis C-methylase UbiE